MKSIQSSDDNHAMRGGDNAKRRSSPTVTRMAGHPGRSGGDDVCHCPWGSPPEPRILRGYAHHVHDGARHAEYDGLKPGANGDADHGTGYPAERRRPPTTTPTPADTSPSTTVTTCDAQSPNVLDPGGEPSLTSGACLVSPNKQNELIMQTDGNLVL